MPKNLPIPAAVVSRTRHCTGLLFALPIGGELQCTASFTDRKTYADGSHADTADSSVTLSQQEIAALPAFLLAYSQLSAAVHAKRATYDPAP